MNKMAHTERAIQALRWRWAGVSLAFGASLVLGWLALRQIWPQQAELWLIFSVLAAVYVLFLLGSGLKNNHLPGASALLPILGWGNGVSLLRGILLSLLAGFVLIPEPIGWLAWIPASLFLTASCLDLVDGYVARRQNQATVLGATLDIELDGLGALLAILLAIKYGDLPLWFLLLAPLRPLFIAGIGWRRRRGLPLFDMHPSIYRRITAGMQVSVINAVLWPVVHPPASTLAGLAVAGAVGVSFARDWLVTIGWLDASADPYWLRKERLKFWLVEWAPLALRLVLSGLALSVLLSALNDSPVGVDFLWPAPQAESWTGSFFFALFLLTAAMTGIGVVGRLAAGLLAAATIPYMVHVGLTWTNGVLLWGSLYLFLSGSGRFSLWEPERRFFTEQLGRPGASR